jgi:hypothetical protein
VRLQSLLIKAAWRPPVLPRPILFTAARRYSYRMTNFAFFPNKKHSSQVHTLHLLIRYNVTLTVCTNILERRKKKCSMQIYARVDLQRESEVSNPPQLFGIIFFNVCVRPFCECESALESFFTISFVCKRSSRTHMHTRENI